MVIVTVTPDEMLSIALPDESVVEMVNDPEVAVVLGFLIPPNANVKAVPVVEYPLE